MNSLTEVENFHSVSKVGKFYYKEWEIFLAGKFVNSFNRSRKFFMGKLKVCKF